MIAVVSSSKNAPSVLAAAGLADRFEVVVDGAVAAREGIPGKPEPDMFERAAELLGLPTEACAVVEDAESGVKAGAAGEFGIVIGVDRGVGREALERARRRRDRRRARRAAPRRRARGRGIRSRPGRARRGIRPRFPHPEHHPRGPFMRFADHDPLNRSRFPIDEWALVETDFGVADMGRTETLFAVGNGYLGLRGNVEEGRDGHMHGTFVNGFHETWPIRHAEEAFGFARVGQTIVNAPDAKVIRLYVDDEPLVLTVAELLSYERRLDFRLGALSRSIEWRTPSGKRVLITSRAHGVVHRPPPRRASTTRSSCSTRMPR